MADTVQIVNGPTIAAGQSVSNAVDCSAGKIIRITTPAEWNNYAPISFLVSTDNVFFSDLYKSDGLEFVLPCGKGRGIIVNQNDWWPGLWVKIRSGTHDAPIPQTAQREFAIALLVAGA